MFIFVSFLFLPGAGVTRRVALAGVEHAELAVKAQHRPADQGHPMPKAGGVDALSGVKVVAAIDHHLGLWHPGVKPG